MKSVEFEYLKEGITTDLAELLIKDYNMTIVEALDTLYHSDTYAQLCNPNTGLYIQSSLYIYSFLKHELATGKIG